MSIQAAIDAASVGDVIIVSPGTYREDIRIRGKAVTLTSLNPADPAVVEKTIIRGSVRIDSAATGTPVLAGFTIDGGYGPGGIRCYGSSPIILRNRIVNVNNAYSAALHCDCPQGAVIENSVIGCVGDELSGGIWCEGGSGLVVSGNLVVSTIVRGYSGGGGIVCWEGSPTIVGNTITGTYVNCFGGGIWCTESQPLVSGNVVSSNVAHDHGGGGIFCSDSAPLIEGNVITGNASAGGGGICVTGESRSGSSPSIAKNTIVGNLADLGGAVYSFSAKLSLVANVIGANNATESGGGIHSGGEHAELVNNLIVDNVARWGNGGGMSFTNADILMVNNTIVGNKALNGLGGGAYLTGGASAEMWNCILDANEAGVGRQVALEADQWGAGTLTYSFTMIRGGTPSIWRASGEPGCVVTEGPGNKDADPLLAAPTDWWGGDYRLLPGSPCIDAGSNAAPGLPDRDLAGVARVIDGNLDGTATVDMGAYEHVPGDVNGDGKVGILDLLVIRNNFTYGLATASSERKCDLNADGRVDVQDLLIARNLLLR